MTQLYTAHQVIHGRMHAWYECNHSYIMGGAILCPGSKGQRLFIACNLYDTCMDGVWSKEMAHM